MGPQQLGSGSKPIIFKIYYNICTKNEFIYIYILYHIYLFIYLFIYWRESLSTQKKCLLFLVIKIVVFFFIYVISIIFIYTRGKPEYVNISHDHYGI